MNSKKAGLYFMLVVILSIGASIGLSFGSSFFELSFVPAAILSELMLLVPGLILLAGCEKNKGEIMQLGPIHPANFILLPIFGVLMYPLIIVSNMVSLFFTHNEVAAVSKDVISQPFAVMFIVIGVFGPVCEELAFRSILLGSLKRSNNILGAILLQAFCFGLIHLNLNQFCYAFVFGIVLGLVVEATGTVLSSILLHGLLNSVNVVMLYSEKRVIEDGTVTAAASEMLNPGVLIVILGVVSMIALFMTSLGGCLLVKIAKLQHRADWYKRLLPNKNHKSVWSVCMVIGVLLCVCLITLEVVLENVLRS